MSSRGQPQSQNTANAALSSWMLAVAALLLAGFVAIDRIFVDTTRGQRIDDAGLAGSVIGRDRIISEVERVLNLVSVGALVGAIVVVAVIGAVRRRPGLAALSILVLAVANVSTRILKTQLLHRPDLGVDSAAGLAHNTLPSGHTTVGISVSVALVLVAAPAVRPFVALCGAIASAVLGVSTLSAGWHRPSDAVAACLLVGAIGCGLGAVAAVFRQVAAPVGAGVRIASTSLIGAGVIGLIGAGIALGRVGQVPESTERRHLFLAYAGGSVGVAGAACLTMGLLLLIASALDPARPAPRPAVDRQARASATLRYE